MFYVYVLKSTKNNDLYVGYTEDLRKRYLAHNMQRVKSRKGGSPWNLLYCEAYKNKQDATRREKQLKQHKEKNVLKIQIKESLKT